MARPVVRGKHSAQSGHREVPRLQWNDHDWVPVVDKPAGQPFESNEAPTNRRTREGKRAAASQAA